MATYIFMPELVGIAAHNLSHWLEDNQLLRRTSWDKTVLDVEKAIKLEHDLRPEQGPTLCFTLNEMFEEAKWGVPKEFLQKIVDAHYDKAKATDKFYEYISEPYDNSHCIRLIGMKFNSGFWSQWVEVTIQLTKKYQKKWKGKLVDRIRVLTLGYHIEKVSKPTLLKLLESQKIMEKQT